MTWEQVLTQLGEFRARQEQIKANPNLSEQGRKIELERVQAQHAAFEERAYQALEVEWRDLRERYRDSERQFAQAELEESERWNYPKLEHERAVLEGVLSGASSREELERVFEQYQHSGVPERRRALFELVPVHAREQHAGALAKQAERSLEREITTPAMDKAQQRGSLLVATAVKLAQCTEQVSGEYYASRRMMGQSDRFRELMEGIKFSEHVDPERFGQVTTLTISE